MAARKKRPPQAARRQGQQQAIPGWIWLVLGIAMGLGLAIFLLTAGMLPRGERSMEDDPDVPRPRVETGRDRSELVEPEDAPTEVDYDFYTILPEMDVVVPETEMSRRIELAEAQQESGGPYQIQVGSFRQFADADRIKAELAFLGVQSTIVSVTINEKDYHRVRVGPFDRAREAESMKLKLRDNGYQTLVLKERS